MLWCYKLSVVIESGRVSKNNLEFDLFSSPFGFETSKSEHLHVL